MNDRRLRSRRHGYGLVLVLGLASVSFQVAAPDADWARLVGVLLGAAILSTAVWAARSERTFVRLVAAAVVMLALATLSCSPSRATSRGQVPALRH